MEKVDCSHKQLSEDNGKRFTKQFLPLITTAHYYSFLMMSMDAEKKCRRKVTSVACSHGDWNAAGAFTGRTTVLCSAELYCMRACFCFRLRGWQEGDGCQNILRQSAAHLTRTVFGHVASWLLNRSHQEYYGFLKVHLRCAWSKAWKSVPLSFSFIYFAIPPLPLAVFRRQTFHPTYCYRDFGRFARLL